MFYSFFLIHIFIFIFFGGGAARVKAAMEGLGNEWA